MKIFRNGILVYLFALISSCQSPLVFAEPQPKGEPELSTIPKEYQGVYWCKLDSISLIIDDQIISRQKKFESKLSLAEIESNPNLSFQNESLYSNDFNQSFPAKQVGETIISQITLKDTLFSRTTGQVLKFYKGHLILNTPLDDGVWEVTIISKKQKDILSVTKANLPDNLKDLEQITAIKESKTDENQNVVQIKIDPTKVEFDQILNKEMVFDGSCVEFERIFPTPEIDL